MVKKYRPPTPFCPRAAHEGFNAIDPLCSYRASTFLGKAIFLSAIFILDGKRWH
jgi:hypothetical protein